MTAKSDAEKAAEELAAIRNDPERKTAATTVAQLAVDRFNNLYGAKHGNALVEQFAAYIVEQATDVDAGVLKKHATNLSAQKLIDPDGWAKRKPWLAEPKGRRLLKALMTILKDGDKAAEKHS